MNTLLNKSTFQTKKTSNKLIITINDSSNIRMNTTNNHSTKHENSKKIISTYSNQNFR